MPRTPPFDLSSLILAGLALTFGLVASWKDPGLPVSVSLLVVLASSVMASLAFPIIPGWLVKLHSHE